ncbi:alpha/beta-Hydrolases superfamily protein [Actinidia rufa]|uniref:Alpha/beta-Hydrolases superfamily protein n=1 Tax=Actinidia rufa TaxID=165716 RepID=A0A7J0EU90_9ERIC|nr:alpha/beta-Hydrolases superfamily protein [Actinidia rufa]
MASPVPVVSEASVAAQATDKTTAPYGSWKSPITADLVSGSEKRLEGFAVDTHNHLVWLDRAVLVREAEEPGDEPTDVTPIGFSVRSTAQEYGGGAFNLAGNIVVFSNLEDQRLYKQFLSSQDSTLVSLTPNYGGPIVRYADGVFDSRLNRYVCVREDHRGNSAHPTTEIVSIDLRGESIQEPKVLVSGNDFYAFPRMDRKGERLAWIEWSHPNMHWDKAELWVGYISETGDVYKRVCVAGAAPSLIESPTEPKWSLKGELFFITDRNRGFWNIYKWIEERCEVRTVYSLDAEFTQTTTINSASDQNYRHHLIVLAFVSVIPLLRSSMVTDNTLDQNMWLLDSAHIALEEVKGSSVGGPTDEAHGILNLNIQYWTSRGWAFVDVNYGGSTGYGREYRERLLGSWGIVDINDCCCCAKFLVDDGTVDGERLCITGCSAGGYTTLASLAFRETFKAGASLFGIADLKSLRDGMHKFESHYISNLVGTEEALFERSPINFVDKFSCPIILFQGLEDKVVHPEQAHKIYTALKKKGLPVALVEYDGEPHGFRKAENIKSTLEQQMVFFARTVGHFTVADEIIPIQIDNFD